MSDSLKDQLLKAGFKEATRSTPPSKKRDKNPAEKKTGKQHSAGKSPALKKHTSKAPKKQSYKPQSNTRGRDNTRKKVEDPAVIAEKKRIKSAIKELIDNNAIKDSTGEIAYSYMLGSRVKQIFVKKDILEKLAADELVITRLNGSTHIIQPELVEQILALNPDWAIIRNDAKTSGNDENEAGYEDYKIPDDLMW